MIPDLNCFLDRPKEGKPTVISPEKMKYMSVTSSSSLRIILLSGLASNLAGRNPKHMSYKNSESIFC